MEKLYHLAKRFKAYQFDGDLKNSDGYYCPEWVQQAFERDELFFIGPELYLDHFENCGLELERTHIRVGDYITLDMENMRIDAFSPAQLNRFFEAVNINDKTGVVGVCRRIKKLYHGRRGH